MDGRQSTANVFQSMSNSSTLNHLVLLTENSSLSPLTLMSIPQNITVNQDQSVSVAPINYKLDRNANLSCNTAECSKSDKIQIKCQPRSKFRPRTQNESKNSSHYLRCEDGAEHDHPTIYIPSKWATQSDTNIIEIALMDTAKQPHPYVIDNKNARDSFDNDTLIVKRTEPNILYFRLTNEDILSGFKAFMIEFIKSKQDDVITKKLIRSRKLDQSMLRFTRIYRDQYGNLHRDDDSQEYSCVMTENYGDVSVEHIGPRFGAMRGQEMMFVLFKGRIAKEDLSLTITEPISKWSYQINKFMINGSLIYFSMPDFPYSQVSRANVRIEIYFKQQRIHQFDYLYSNLLDQESKDSNSDISLISNTIHQLQFDAFTGQSSVPPVFQKPSKSKSTKRLNTNK